MGIFIDWIKLENQPTGNNNFSVANTTPGTPAQPTRTSRTENDYFRYTKNAIGLIRQFLSIGEDESINSEDINRWLSATRSSYRASTWRFARAAFSNLLEKAALYLSNSIIDKTDYKVVEETKKEISEIINSLEKIKKLKWSAAPINIGKTTAQRSKELPPKSSSNKKKFVEPDILFRLDEFIRHSGSDWQRRGLILSWAMMFTGLRPCEWENVDMQIINEHTIKLIVINAKSTNGRANGLTRELIINNEVAMKAVQEQVASVINWKANQQKDKEVDFRKTYVASCANGLRIAQIQCFGKSYNITPYSFRHQFSANMKSSGQSKEIIAYLMGHASELTAGQHYGKKRKGYSSISSRRSDAMAATIPKDFSEKLLNFPIPGQPVRSLSGSKQQTKSELSI